DPGRELRVAVRALSAAGEVGTAAERMARRATAALVPTAPAYAARIAVLDSLGRLCDVDRTRPPSIHGSKQSFYVRSGESAPQSDGLDAERGRIVGTEAIADLRVRYGRDALARLGLEASVDVEPIEPVPGQSVRATWCLRGNPNVAWTSCAARIAGR